MTVLIIIAQVAALAALALGITLSIVSLATIGLVVAVGIVVLGLVLKVAKKVLGCSGILLLLGLAAFVWFVIL